MIAIIDYGVGNLFSLKSSFDAIGVKAEVVSDKAAILASDGIVLPGVGAFEDAAKKLFDSGLAQIILDECERGKPLMGICLGMQLLFDRSLEYGDHKGLGLIPGVVRPIADVIPKELKIPHMGWNALEFRNGKHRLFDGINEGDHVYFVHSYYADTPEENIIAVSEYGYPLTAAVARNNVMGCQFHPEKSGSKGLEILKAFADYTTMKAGAIC